MNYIRKYNCELIMSGITNHFDTLPDDIIKIILKNEYPIEVYKFNNNELENKKKMIIELDDTDIEYLGRLYFKNIQLLCKPDNKIRLPIIYDKNYKNVILTKNFYKNYDPKLKIHRQYIYDWQPNLLLKKNRLVLNDCGMLEQNRVYKLYNLNKCICGKKCSIYNINRINCSDKDVYYRKYHYNNLKYLIRKEKKITEYGNKLRFCVDCNKPIKLESVQQHLKSNYHIRNCKH